MQRYKRENGQLVKIAETPVLENGKVDISWLPVVGTMGSAVIERGSNANGEYVKFADGTMVCKTGWYYLGSDTGVLKNVTFPAALHSGGAFIPAPLYALRQSSLCQYPVSTALWQVAA